MIKAITKSGIAIKINPAKELAAGGEGIVYEVDSNIVAKIYHPGIKPISENKFKFLSGLDPNYFVAPLDLLYDSKGVIIGYTMKYVDQNFFPLSNLYSKNFCKSNGIDKKVKMKVVEKLIAAVNYAHKENVVIGDLNPFNILVNNKGVVKFIDTDSYETPGFPHSHILLDDIRDYYYQGRVSKESDFFAMSILSFNMLSFLHPFKGMHKTYKKIGDRMIHKLPVFINDPDIVIPKCYEPIQDKNFNEQFKKLYLQGERFLLSLSGVDDSLIAISPLAKPSLVKKYEQDDLVITMIMQESEEVLNINFLDRQGMVETPSEFIIYDSSNKGYLSLKHRIKKYDWDKIFIGNENILLKKGSELWNYRKDGSLELMKNFKFPSIHIITQMEDILIVIGPDDMYKLFIDQVGAGTVMTEHIGVYGKGFSNHSGFIHNSGGKQNLFYNSGKNLSITQSPVQQVNGVYQKKNVGIIQYVDNKKLKFKFFKIDGLKIKMSSIDLDSISNFAFLPNIDSKGKAEREGMIFSPADDKILIYRTNDFEKVGEMNCSIVTSQSVIHKCDAGIIVWDENTVALLNKK